MKSIVYFVFIVLLTVTTSVPVLAKPIEARIVSVVGVLPCSGVTEIPQLECEALVALYNSTNGPLWTNKTNWLGTDTPSNWYGVTVASGHVLYLDLHNNHLVGTIPPQLGNLSILDYLDLGQNELSGNIPPELGMLTKLTYLGLWWNELTGEIPLSLCNLTSLMDLSLYGNLLIGNIPPQLNKLTSLVGLYLGANNLSGSIPPELGTLNNLTAISLYDNQLSGGIPPELGNLSHLDALNLTQNQLRGDIPHELGKATSLRLLWLHNNKLSGDIPATFLNLVNLADPGQYGGEDGLDLDYNYLNVPLGYPNPANPLQTFLYQKDPDWHLRQSIFLYFFLPILQR